MRFTVGDKVKTTAQWHKRGWQSATGVIVRTRENAEELCDHIHVDITYTNGMLSPDHVSAPKYWEKQ